MTGRRDMSREHQREISVFQKEDAGRRYVVVVRWLPHPPLTTRRFVLNCPRCWLSVESLNAPTRPGAPGINSIRYLPMSFGEIMSAVLLSSNQAVFGLNSTKATVQKPVAGSTEKVGSGKC